MAKPGAPAAYRGYRLQALYALSRILDPASNHALVFQPEGYEDLAIWTPDGSLLEVVQVKSYTDLTLSNLKSDKGLSFFTRASELALKTSRPTIKLVNFGSIGREMKSCWAGDQYYCDSIANKLTEAGFNNQSISNIFSFVELVEADERTITESVLARLSESCTGTDPENAFDLLNFWLYKISEEQTRVQYVDIINKLNSVAQFLAETRTHHTEWYTSILPVSDRVITQDERPKLQGEFYAGTRARYEHILADLDFPRENKCQEIKQAFEQSNTVIIHAASGQGKTTLAYRYLHDYYPENWRFSVALIQDRQHALDILRALMGHAKALQVPMAIYIDVSPRDTEWPELVKGLADHPQFQILVTIREEDFRRANLDSSDFPYAEVELRFDEPEARYIYDRAVEQGKATGFLDFSEAWAKFGERGPLMEFVYLLTQTETLRTKLKSQINRIRDEINAGQILRNRNELDLLRLVAVASSYEARIRITSLSQALDIPDLPRTLHLYEKEYLLRQSTDGAYIEGLHPIRSLILADLLSDPVISPWITTATKVLSLISETDLEGFILHSLVDRESDSEMLLDSVAHLKTSTWTGTAAIFRCLMWSGIRSYIQANWPLIQEMYPQWGIATMWVLDLDFTHLVTEAYDSLLNLLPTFGPNHGRERLEEYRSRQTPTSNVTHPLTEWLSNWSTDLNSPQTENDWRGIAELLFWCGEFKTGEQFLNRISDAQLTEATIHQRLNLVADIALALYTCSPAQYDRWLTTNRQTIYSRLADEYGVIAIQPEEQNLRIHFLPEIYNYRSRDSSDVITNGSTGSEPVRERTIERIHIIRYIFPTYATYSSRGYSYTFGALKLPYDFTLKEGIPIRSLPPIWPVKLNSLTRNMLLNGFRPASWDDYINLVMTWRDANVKCFANLQRGLITYIQRDKPVDVKGKYLDTNLWQQCMKLSNQSPLLPRCALDPWGLASEEDSQTTKENAEKVPYFPKSVALQKYAPFVKLLNSYGFSLNRFLTQALDVMDTNLCVGKQKPGSPTWELGMSLLKENHIDTSRGPQTTADMFDLCHTGAFLSDQFRALFRQAVNNIELDGLDAQEKVVLGEIGPLWYFYANHPGEILSRPIAQTRNRMYLEKSEIEAEIQKSLKAGFPESTRATLLGTGLSWGDESTLWIRIDLHDPIEYYVSAEKTFAVLGTILKSITDRKLIQHLIDQYWYYVVIIPVIRGKLINHLGWKVSMQTVINGITPESAWKYELQEIPTTARQTLGLSAWDNQDVNTAHTILASVAEISVLCSQLADLTRSPNIDDVAKLYAQKDVDYRMGMLNKCLQLAFDTLTTMLTKINEHDMAHLIQQRPYLAESYKVIRELHELILPFKGFNGVHTVEIEIFPEYSKRLQDAFRLAQYLHLCWIRDALDYSCTST